MAKLKTMFQFTGPLGEFSAYQMRGVDGIVVRRKGGPTRKQIATASNFDGMRRRGAEFWGASG